MSQPPTRFDILSRSSSGLSYVRDKKGGVMRVLSESELEDFSDPPPCPQCSEQFGCEHINCAGEPMLPEDEVERDVPAEWLPFAKTNGVSRNDLERLRCIEAHEGEYRLRADTPHDMRTLEILLLVNGE